MRPITICAFSMLLLASCASSEQKGSCRPEGHLGPYDPVYDDYASSYWKQVEAQRFPLEYGMEKKLLLIAHGFDPHVRGGFAADLWDDIRDSEQQKRELFSYMKSDDPALAWAAAWVVEKTGYYSESDCDFEETYEREDVKAFEEKYHR